MARLNRSMLSTLLIIGLFVMSAHANAAIDASSIDNMIEKFQTAASTWQAPLLNYATNLFWILAFIQFSWAMIGLAFRGDDLSIWASTIVNQIMYVGFMSWLLMNSATFAEAIVNCFRQAASTASGYSLLTPSDFFVNGWKIVQEILNSVSAWSPIDSLGMLIASIIIMIAFALICAFLVLALVEMYIVVSASVLMMGFAGSQWTKDYALKTIQYAVSVGAKIFILQLIAGLGLTFIKEWATGFNVEDNVSLVGMIGCSVVLLALTKIVPDMLQGVINGSSIGSGAALTSALRAVAAATAGAAAGAAGASMATKGAGALASEQLKTAQATGTGPSSAMGKAGFMAGNMAMNMSSALKSDLGSRLSGSTTGGRMAGSMMNKANELRSKRSKSNQDENTIS